MNDSTNNREAYREINALVASIAKALGLKGDQAARELETGAIRVEMGEDEDGARFVLARRGDVAGRVCRDALRRAPGAESPGFESDAEPPDEGPAP